MGGLTPCPPNRGKITAAWEDLYYNFVHPLKTLRVELFDESPKRWEPCTPAMAAGLTGHIWPPKELLTTIIPPSIGNT